MARRRRLSKSGGFVGQHICVPLEGAAVHINAFNFPVWGMLEKLAPTFLAGVPAIVKPATRHGLSDRAGGPPHHRVGHPAGRRLQLICGSVGNLFDHLTCQDVVAFTGSASTARKLRVHPDGDRPFGALHRGDRLAQLLRARPRRDARDDAEFDLFVSEVAREMTVKAGQKCTAIRKAIVPAASAADVLEALQAALAKVVLGNPRLEQVRMGPVASLAQRARSPGAQLARLQREAEIVCGNGRQLELADADADRGAFIAPTLLYAGSRRAPRPFTRSRPSVRSARWCPTRVWIPLSRSPRRGAAASSARYSRPMRNRRGAARARSRAVPRPAARRQPRLRARNRPDTARRCRIWSTADRAARAVARRWAASAASCHYMQRTAVQGTPLNS